MNPMKKKLLFTLCSILLLTQEVEAQLNMNRVLSNPIGVDRYELKAGTNFTLKIPMYYGSSKVFIPADLESLRELDIKEIHLVYTDYPVGKDLISLNKNRLRRITNVRKDLVSDTSVIWKVFRQTGCSSEEEAHGMFHGLVVHYAPNSKHRSWAMRHGKELNGYLPSRITKELALEKINSMEDPLVYNTLTNVNWNNMAVIADFTSSMYPHSAQLVLWFAIHTHQTKIAHIYFFNDGDLKVDSLKKIGKTGGIYHENRANFNDVRKLAFQTMKNGIGGKDLEENDLEAVLFAIQNSPEVDGYILIADNNAPPRDMVLLSQLNKPVHIILCGALEPFYAPENLESTELPPQVEIAYIEIAKKTGGSIISMEDDLYRLMIKE